MTAELNEEAQGKLREAQNIWIGTVRPDGRPHLVPVWFAWSLGKLYVSIDPNSVKRRNLEVNRQVVLALEDGSHPVICEGLASQVQQPYPEEVWKEFKRKYDWDINTEAQYNQLVEVQPAKWLVW